ncbi:hypothetical protein GQ472_06875 [archaeon]|nr:hypothetical protein [archaeon]
MDWLKKIGKIYKKEGNDIYIKIDVNNLQSTIKTIKDNNIGHITAITGIDTKKEIEIIYHFWTGKQMINIKTAIDRNLPKIKTITKDFPGAMLYEMELAEMLGVQVEGAIKEHLLLAKESPIYPLRRD